MSNCGAESRRLDYVRQLRGHVNVTQVGPCEGTVHCSKDPDGNALRSDIDCMQKLNGRPTLIIFAFITLLDEHHFYLAFENSVCPEYTSEKFWRMKQLIVPIVLSRAVMPKDIPKNTCKFIRTNRIHL